MRNFGVMFLFIIVLSSTLVLAQISINEPKDFYNIGDKLYIDVSGIIGSESGNLNIDLICNEQTINLIKIPSRSFSSAVEQNYSVPYKIFSEEDLEINNIKNLVGNCQIVSSLGTEQTNTKTFELSDKLSLSTKLDKDNYAPGESALLAVEVLKANGEGFTGKVFVSSSSYNFDFEVVEGLGEYNFLIEETAASGDYSLKVKSYDGEADSTLNFGETDLSFKVDQVPSSLVLSLSSENINPGSEIEVGYEVYDQSGNFMDGEGIVRLIGPNGTEISKELASGRFTIFPIPTNATAGEWSVIGASGELSDKRKFNVPLYPLVSFDIEGTTLTIKNIGNVIYNKSINVKIGEEEKSLEAREIAIGEIIKFNLRAPDGEYEVIATDGASSFNRNVYLTGRSISIQNPGDDGTLAKYSILIWMFFIILLAGAGIVLYSLSSKTRVIGKPSIKDKFRQIKSKIMRKKESENLVPSEEKPKFSFMGNKKESEVMDLTNTNSMGAESSLVLKGEKQRSSVICLKIKNYSELNENSRKSLIEIVRDSSKAKGLVDWKEEYVFIVFSPLVTKTYSNEVLASKTGFLISKKLEEHNKKFNNKIKFNIGVHSGELVSSKEGGKLKYTSIGNTVSFAKKISDFADSRLLVSEEIRKKLLRDLKVEKAGKLGENYIYAVSEIRDREANADKLKDILKRM